MGISAGPLFLPACVRRRLPKTFVFLLLQDRCHSPSWAQGMPCRWQPMHSGPLRAIQLPEPCLLCLVILTQHTACQAEQLLSTGCPA